MVDDPYRMLPMQIPTLRNTVRPVQLGAGLRPTVGGTLMQQPPTSTAQMMGARNMYAPQSLQAGVMRQAQQPKSQAELLAAYGLGRKPVQTVGSERRGAGAPAARTGLSGMLPAAGTPEMAGLGAAGRTLMQLGGWQDKPMTLGQILGAGAEKGIEAMQARRDAIAAAEEKEAAAERQARLDKLTRLKTLSDIAKAQQPELPKTLTRTLPDGRKQDYVLDAKSPRADKYGLAPYGEPYSDIKDVTPTSLMQNIRAAYGTLDSPEAKAALKAGIEGQTKGNFQSKGTVVGADGIELGSAVFDTSTGKTMLSVAGADGEELLPMPSGSQIITPSQESKVIMNIDNLNKLEETIDLSVQSMNGLTSYLESIDKAPVGLNRLYNNFVADTKTLFTDFVNFEVDGKKVTELNEGQLNAALAQGKLQSLIGQFRLETVGGGVMTEQDAIRILWSLGGDVNALQKPEVVKDAMTRMFKKKHKHLERQIRQYNTQIKHPTYMMMQMPEIEMPEFDESLLSEKVVKQSARTKFKQGSLKGDGEGVGQPQPEVDLTAAPQGFPAEDWAVLSDKDKRDYLAAGQ